MEHIREEILQTKGEIRKYVLNMRDNMLPEERIRCQGQIREQVLNHISYREAQTILAYASFRSEVDTMMLMEQALADGKYVFVPRVAGKDMEFWRITTMEDLKSGYMGIPEPVQNVSFPEWLAENAGSGDRSIGKESAQTPVRVMMWMPGAVFDRERHRIGYGKGFYDRYLSKLSDEKKQTSARIGEYQMTTAALAYSCQIVLQIPCEPHDIRPDMVVTEKGII